MAKKKSAEERRRRAAELKAQRQKEERRRKMWKIAGISTAAALVLGLLVFAIVMEVRSRIIPGMEEFEGVTREHVDMGQAVDYDQSPPAGGDHWASWQNCDIYTEPVTPELAVHALEHGAVWITHAPDLDEAEVERLHDMYNPGDYLLISPYEGDMDAPIVASSWGRQIATESVDDDAFQRFVTLYERGTDVPEPGAACSGAVGETAEELQGAAEDIPEEHESGEGAEDAEADEESE